jgi:hypothetical protein
MAAQSITTDLTNIATAEPGTLGSWAALGGGASGLSEETDYFVQGSTCISKQVKQETKGMHADFGSSVSFGTGDHVFTWLNSTTPGAADLRANGGLRVTMGDSANARKEYYVNGSDNYRYGGWLCYPVDPGATPDNPVGNAGTTPRYFGGICSNSVTVKGINFGVDVIRYGTGIDATGGGSPDPDITFADIAAANDLQANAWGVFQGSDTGGTLQGRIRIGADDTSTSTTFGDVDAVVTKPNNNPADVNVKTASDFSGIIIAGSNTTADFLGCLFQSLDTTDKGFFDSGSATNAPSVYLDACTFISWGATTLQTGTSVENCAFKNSSDVTLGGATLNESSFTDSGKVIGSLSDIQNCTFLANGATTYAIETSDTGSVSLTGNTFTGYGSSGTATAAIHFTATSGSVTVAVSGGAVPTFTSDGVSVTMTLSTTLTLTGLIDDSEVRIYDAGTTTEVAGVENTSGGSFVAGISVSSVDIVIHSLGYLNQRINAVDTSTDRTIPIQQTIDRQYENPA